ncbi:LysR family transcriptional regulator [Amycolatopsis taiwanensis]|uniref:LysR family transcriptional regulator n=1 Tax=Amycolatopsis taiwanensis TaxID=342230 RepID=A0A9W6QVZ0_9PSEU|nr:LysR family transcriptional regulator [Amycolatopsis taiwanensis]GLY65036.1 LysR family transcriptional regulator [Amycolatopsis taiwanensis]
MIDWRRLRVLRAVDHYGTVTAAARALHFTTSAASQQIRQLGRELDLVLLEQQGRGVRLTPAARTLLAHADAIQARWEQAQVDLYATLGKPAGLLRVSGFPVAISTLLAPMAAALKASHDDLTVQIQEAELRDSLDLLFESGVDLAIIEATPENPPLNDPRFDQQELLDDPFDLVVAATHPLARRTEVALAEAATEDWIAPLSGSTCHTHTFSACTAAGFTPAVAHRAAEWNAMAHLAAHGLGVALVPRLAHIAADPPVVRIPITGNPRPVRKLLTCTRRGGRTHPAVEAALGELKLIAPTVLAQQLRRGA